MGCFMIEIAPKKLCTEVQITIKRETPKLYYRLQSSGQRSAHYYYKKVKTLRNIFR